MPPENHHSLIDNLGSGGYLNKASVIQVAHLET